MALFALVTLLVGWRRGPRSTHVTPFDANQALGTLDRLLGLDPAPRPMGSPAHTQFREGIVAELQRLGWAPQVQTQLICNRGRCATVRNVVALHPDADPVAPVVLLVAHYDSVPNGPGIADDAAGVVTVLQAAGLTETPTRNALGVLLTDGEEVGLLGARAFVQHHPLRERVRAVVNVEARGTHGASYLFETSVPNGWLSRIATRAIGQPNASSLFFEVYKRLPNDTDLTVFKEAGLIGANFAFLDGVAHYHTALDDREHLDPVTVQQQGDAATALWWALGDADLGSVPDGNDVYADVLGLFVLRWPELIAVPLAGVAGLWISVLVGLRRHEATARVWIVAGISVPLGLVAVGVGSLVVPRLSPVVGLWVATLGVAGGLSTVMQRVSPWVWFGAVWSWVAVGGLAVAWVSPGASYLFVAPLFTALCTASVAHGLGRDPAPFFLAGASLGLIFWVQLALTLPIALGPSGPVVVVPLAIAAAMCLPGCTQGP